MSESVRSGYLALVVFCCFALGVIAFLNFTYFFSKGYQSANQEHSAYYAERDQVEISYRECLDSSDSLDSARECVDNPADGTRESERAEQDLNAQREMADWAEGMLWAAWIVGTLTFGATVIGVRYIYFTLLATQDMAKDTREIGKAQVRAYLGRESCAAWEGTGIEFDGVITNCGNSPAINAYMMIELVYWQKTGDRTFTIHEIYTVPQLIGTIPSNGRIGTGRTSFIGFFGGSKEGGVYDVRSANLCLLGRDVFDDEISFYGGIGYFQHFEEYEKKRIHPAYLAPDGFYGNRGKAMQVFRDWVAENKYQK